MKTPPADLLQAATSILKSAYAPYSHLRVTTAIRAENNDIFVGCNVENAAFPLGTCAETNAIGALIATGNKIITEALILVENDPVCPPCGACRQRLLEFSKPTLPIHLCTLKKSYSYFTLDALLPCAFSAKNLEHHS